MQLVSFGPEHAFDAARMFVASLQRLRADVPALSGTLADIGAVAEKLSRMRGFAAVQDGRLVGYLTGWFPIEAFRGADRVGAYVPEWGHCLDTDRAAVYGALYRAASREWASAGCDTHALTILANDASLDTWFWHGFGLGTVDAVRSMEPLHLPAPDGFTVRAASPADATDLAVLDAEHTRHYAEPPVFMVPPSAFDAPTWSAFLADPRHTAWLAEDADGPFGFLRFDRAFDGSDVIVSDTGVFISGAYVRATHRRRGAAAAILDAALRHHADEGLTCCALDFEAFNPEATAFWLRSFAPVCYSLMRVPEAPRATG